MEHRISSGAVVAKSVKKERKKHSAGDMVFYILNYAFFILFTFVCAFPFYYLFINTISDNELIKAGTITFLPRGIHFDNYLALSSVNNLGASILVSIARTITGTILTVIASAFAGYLVTKKELWGRRFWYRFMVVTMYFNAGLIPWYLNMSMLGLTNKFAAYILPGIVAPFYIILVKTYVESIPVELEESAAMDGAGYIRRFVQIIFPLCKPILATIAVFSALGHWNSFIDSMILMGNEPKLQTLQHRLYTYLQKASNLQALMDSGRGVTADMVKQTLNERSIKFTVAMVSILPILCVYPFLQKYFQKGIMLGAVKG